ncbi:tyrosine-type recombinase/integrase [Flavonifractor plautii]|nr:tyrosine-type recombinase/integrase [Flavonifractor plautii]MDB7922081.1 tyrosine-type recombinase/integrase [Flavonifractor plautii]MDB7945958.1 tyrosine-type recombinase/integrase [Flavonifractor plautii]
MDGGHPKNIDPRPKRRRDEENPYEIYTTGINTTHPRYFLAFTDSNKVKRWMEIDKALRNLLKKYNKQHKEPLPNITPHSFRHTFCTRMANAGMNPKALQYIMGHANITMTLDYYTHVDACSVRAEMERLAA